MNRHYIPILAAILLCVGSCQSTSQNTGSDEPKPDLATTKFALQSVLSSKGLTCADMQAKTGVHFQYDTDLSSANIALADGQTFAQLPVKMINRHWKRSTNNKGNKGGLCLGSRVPESAHGSWAAKRMALCVKWQGGDGTKPQDWHFWTWWIETPSGVKEGATC